MTESISPQALHDALTDGGEIALLDVREEGVFAKRHILRACPMALSRLEIMVAKLVPRRGCRVVLCDAGDGLSERAAARLAGFGYGEVAVLAGGVEAWAAAGYELYAGVNVPSKAFGEFVEVTYGTPRISAAELDARRAADDDLVILDSRPMTEFRNMSIPGGLDCPGAELAYRVHDAVSSAATTVVVNCAGRTRSIIGAQSLINAGVANPVVALENGTMGWHLAGLELARGAEQRAPEVSADGLEISREAAARVAARFGVKTIDAATLARFEAESDQRSLFVFDVRNPEEFEAGHRAGARLAAGGQLVQATDRYVGTQNARLVLVDDTGVRATMTASWLIQMGWRDTYVLESGLGVLAGGLGDEPLVAEPEPAEVLGLEAIECGEVTAAALDDLLAAGEATVVDLETSLRYRDGHIPGAWFAVRARFADSLARVPVAGTLVLTSPDGLLARLAAPDSAALTDAPVKLLAGGTEAWRAAGLPLETGHTNMADEPDDIFYRPYDDSRSVEQAMNDYLVWEVGLVEQIARDGTVGFEPWPV